MRRESEQNSNGFWLRTNPKELGELLAPHKQLRARETELPDRVLPRHPIHFTSKIKFKTVLAKAPRHGILDGPSPILATRRIKQSSLTTVKISAVMGIKAKTTREDNGRIVPPGSVACSSAEHPVSSSTVMEIKLQWDRKQRQKANSQVSTESPVSLSSSSVLDAKLRWDRKQLRHQQHEQDHPTSNSSSRTDGDMDTTEEGTVESQRSSTRTGSLVRAVPVPDEGADDQYEHGAWNSADAAIIDDPELAERLEHHLRTEAKMRSLLENAAVAEEVVNPGGNDEKTNTRISQHRNCLLKVAVLLVAATILTIGLAVGLTRNRDDGDSMTPTTSPSSAPTASPTVTPAQLDPYMVVLNMTQEDLIHMSDAQVRAWSWLVEVDQPTLPLDNSTTLDYDSHVYQIEQRYVLAVFYFSTDGPNWSLDDGWLSKQHVCQWWGLSCEELIVHAFEFYSNALTGTVPADIGRLTLLQYMDLSENRLGGTLPTQLGNLCNLVHLNLYNNYPWNSNDDFQPLFEGELPTQMFTLTKLTMLDLDPFRMTGTLDTRISQLTALTYFFLSKSELTGTIPTEIGMLTALRILGLGGSSSGMKGTNLPGLVGSLPEQLAGLTGLVIFDVTGNNLTGMIPDFFSSMKELYEVSLTSNKFTGTVPSNLGALSYLYELNLGCNELRGAIPSEVLSLPSLDELCISGGENGLVEPEPNVFYCGGDCDSPPS